MCGFTQIIYIECGHQFVSTTAQHTNLCDYAKMFHLVQGIDCAPSACTQSHDTAALIVAKHRIFGYCDDCRDNVTAEVPRGEDEHTLQKHAHIKPKDTGVYDQHEQKELIDLRNFIEQHMKTGEHIAKKFDAFLEKRPVDIQHISNPDLQMFLAQEPKKYDILYRNAFKQCYAWLEPLEGYIHQHAPNKLFADTMLFVFNKAEKASHTMYQFQELALCLYAFEPTVPSRDFNGSEAQLALFEHLLIASLARTPDTPPAGFSYLYDENFKMPFNTRLTFQLRNAKRQAYIDKPMARAQQRYSRVQQGVMNKKGLSVEIHPGLLEDEPASNIEVEHVPIPDVEESVSYGYDSDMSDSDDEDGDIDGSSNEDITHLARTTDDVFPPTRQYFSRDVMEFTLDDEDLPRLPPSPPPRASSPVIPASMPLPPPSTPRTDFSPSKLHIHTPKSLPSSTHRVSTANPLFTTADAEAEAGADGSRGGADGADLGVFER
ncbi:hypothetical protein N0V83_001263 [Neocucurbitaria cava]|uniref:Uncharacterized protein n=1 Tax=Neocucurbitaria cava TaxID=798079 RepID=A0A9W9CR20_9PLEO|nr:hypothetical protein N0V83_001263 [Neocucurbitaria cava]